MPAWRCTSCDINYPVQYMNDRSKQNTCDACDLPVEYWANIYAHEDWEKRVIYQLGGDEAWSFHPDDDSAPVIYRNDLDTIEVTAQTLRKLGYTPFPFMIVKLNGKYYELLDYNERHQTWTIELVMDNAGFKGGFRKTLRQIRRLPVYREDKSDIESITWELPPDSSTEAQDS